MPHFTIQHEGADIDIELSDQQIINAGYKTNASVANDYVPKENVSATVQSAKNAAKKAARNELKADSEFVNEILLSAGIPVDEDGKPKLEGGMTPEEFQKQLGSQREQWENEITAKKIGPLEEANASMKKQVHSLRDEKFANTVMKLGKEMKVKDSLFFTLPDTPATQTPLVSQLRNRFDWSDEINDFALVSGRDEIGNPQFEVSSVEGRRYAGVKELLKKFHSNPETREQMFSDDRATSTNLGDPNKSGSNQGRTMLRTDFQKLNTLTARKYVRDGGKVVDS